MKYDKIYRALFFFSLLRVGFPSLSSDILHCLDRPLHAQPSGASMLAQCCRHWASIEASLGQHTSLLMVSSGRHQQLQHRQQKWAVAYPAIARRGGGRRFFARISTHHSWRHLYVLEGSGKILKSEASNDAF